MVDAVSGYGDMEGLIAFPFLISAGKHFDVDIFTHGFADQMTPVVHLRLYGLSAAYQFVISHRKACHNLIAGILKFKGQGGDVDGYRHVRIVRIDMRRFFKVCVLFWHLDVIHA